MLLSSVHIHHGQCNVIWNMSIMTVLTGLSCSLEDSMRLSSREGWTPQGDTCGCSLHQLLSSSDAWFCCFYWHLLSHLLFLLLCHVNSISSLVLFVQLFNKILFDKHKALYCHWVKLNSKLLHCAKRLRTLPSCWDCVTTVMWLKSKEFPKCL